jgi:hypothetical protein
MKIEGTGYHYSDTMINDRTDKYIYCINKACNYMAIYNNFYVLLFKTDKLSNISILISKFDDYDLTDLEINIILERILKLQLLT